MNWLIKDIIFIILNVVGMLFTMKKYSLYNKEISSLIKNNEFFYKAYEFFNKQLIIKNFYFMMSWLFGGITVIFIVGDIILIIGKLM
jgi:uncharacterized membrane protein